jgi:hypothetical protein
MRDMKFDIPASFQVERPPTDEIGKEYTADAFFAIHDYHDPLILNRFDTWL